MKVLEEVELPFKRKRPPTEPERELKRIKEMQLGPAGAGIIVQAVLLLLLCKCYTIILVYNFDRTKLISYASICDLVC